MALLSGEIDLVMGAPGNIMPLVERGIRPLAMTDWMHRVFVDAYDWVMVANVVGLSQHADGGVLATKPYASGGAYIDRMSDYCGGCRYDPRKRLGEDACPYTAGYWAFLDRVRPRLAWQAVSCSPR